MRRGAARDKGGHRQICQACVLSTKRLNMNRSRINEWLPLIANVAVVGGIVFLAIEIRQNE
jgi:hypothetical protein